VPEAAPLDPPAFLALAGHALRWQLLVELGRSDRTVQQLTLLVDEPQNLVSYHLGKLRRAGLVSARRSTADGRDSWYAVDLVRLRERLHEAGSALHVGLGPRPEAPPVVTGRVLFLCTGNSARSQMAAALVEARSDGQVEACSAGSHPKALHPNAVRVMQQEHGIDLAGRTPTHLDVFVPEPFDRVITLCDRVREVCPDPPGWGEPAHWSIPDPAAAAPADDLDAGYPAFVSTAAELDVRIGFLLPTLTPAAA
jgi:protein-tyrosine-phosphatase/DNA-binding transcriptional ArsR family regulator